PCEGYGVGRAPRLRARELAGLPCWGLSVSRAPRLGRGEPGGPPCRTPCSATPGAGVCGCNPCGGRGTMRRAFLTRRLPPVRRGPAHSLQILSVLQPRPGPTESRLVGQA